MSKSTRLVLRKGNDGKQHRDQTSNNVPVYFDSYSGKQAKGVFSNDGLLGPKVDLEQTATSRLMIIVATSMVRVKILKERANYWRGKVHFDPYDGIQTKGKLIDSEWTTGKAKKYQCIQ